MKKCKGFVARQWNRTGWRHVARFGTMVSSGIVWFSGVVVVSDIILTTLGGWKSTKDVETAVAKHPVLFYGGFFGIAAVLHGLLVWFFHLKYSESKLQEAPRYHAA